MKAASLIEEVAKRNLPVELMNEYMPEVLVQDSETGAKFNAFAMPNDFDGIEVCAYYAKKEPPFDKFKNCIGAKGLTTYRADNREKEVTALCYSSKWDFLTWMALKGQQPNEEMIVYHGDGLVNACAEHILMNEKITRVLHFRHMDDSGQRADAHLALKIAEGKNEAAPIIYGTMEQFYSGYKDLSECFSDQPQTLRAALNIDTTPRVYYESNIKPQVKPKL